MDIPGSGIVGHVVPLCWRHHQDVTGDVGGHKAKIAYDTYGEKFRWIALQGADPVGDPLSWQPPRMNAPEKPQEPVPDHEHVFEGPASTARCVTCKRPLPRKRVKGEKTEKKRRRKTWVIKVPADSKEDGALVADILHEQVAEIFGHDPSAENLRYHTLCQAYALIIENQTYLFKAS